MTSTQSIIEFTIDFIHFLFELLFLTLIVRITILPDIGISVLLIIPFLSDHFLFPIAIGISISIDIGIICVLRPQFHLEPISIQILKLIVPLDPILHILSGFERAV